MARRKRSPLYVDIDSQMNVFNTLAPKLIQFFCDPTITYGKKVKLTKALMRNISLRMELLLDKALLPREQECLLLSLWGETIPSSARILKISDSTVGHYHTRIREKLNCHSMTEAVFEGIRLGFPSESLLKKYLVNSPNTGLNQARKYNESSSSDTKKPESDETS